MPTRESVEAQALHFEGRAPDPDEFAFRLASDPVFAAEMSVIGWLLIKGVDVPRWYRRAGTPIPATAQARATR